MTVLNYCNLIRAIYKKRALISLVETISFLILNLTKSVCLYLCNYRKLQRVGAVVQKNLTQTRQRQTTRYHLQRTGQVKGKSNASNSIYLRDIRIVRILSAGILGCFVRQVITLGSSSIEPTSGIAS